MRNQKAGIYIHIPFCHAKCIYCDFYSVADRNNEIPEFLAMICLEIDLFFKKNNFEIASKLMEEVILRAPGEAISLDHLGDIYFALGRKREAYYFREKRSQNSKRSRFVYKMKVTTVLILMSLRR